MATGAVSPSSFMVRGHVYTMSLKSTGWYRPLLDTVTSELQYLSNCNNISVKLVGGVWGFFADQFDVSFTYVGDGGDVIAGPVQQAIDAISIDLASVDYVGAYDNTVSGTTTGVPVEGTTAGGGPQVPSTTNITTWLVLGVVGLGLVVFLSSGGPRLVKELTA